MGLRDAAAGERLANQRQLCQPSRGAGAGESLPSTDGRVSGQPCGDVYRARLAGDITVRRNRQRRRLPSIHPRPHDPNRAEEITQPVVSQLGWITSQHRQRRQGNV